MARLKICLCALRHSQVFWGIPKQRKFPFAIWAAILITKTYCKAAGRFGRWSSGGLESACRESRPVSRSICVIHTVLDLSISFALLQCPESMRLRAIDMKSSCISLPAREGGLSHEWMIDQETIWPRTGATLTCFWASRGCDAQYVFRIRYGGPKTTGSRNGVAIPIGSRNRKISRTSQSIRGAKCSDP